MLIVFEGGEGVGKSTQIELVYTALMNTKKECLKTREPGGTPLAEKIRTLFKETTLDNPTPLTELYLISAARAQHVDTVIKPALAQNKIILCDRFLDSTYVYQHILGKIKKSTIDEPMHTILQGLMPNLTLFFHCDVTTAKQRVSQEQVRQTDRLDGYSSHIHSIISQGYQSVLHENLPYPCGKIPRRVSINAGLSKEEVFSQIKECFEKYLNVTLC